MIHTQMQTLQKCNTEKMIHLKKKEDKRTKYPLHNYLYKQVQISPTKITYRNIECIQLFQIITAGMTYNS